MLFIYRGMKPVITCIYILLFAFLIGCSGSTGTIPDAQKDTEQVLAPGHSASSERFLIAYLRLYPDPENLTIDVEPIRETAVHFNVKGFLNPPKCYGCVEFFVNSFDPVTRIMDVDVTLKNPTFLVGYDVRGILIANNTGHEMTNADDWTKLFDDSDPLDINPFKAFEVDDPERQFIYYETDTRKVLFRVPKPPNWGGFDYAVDASWPGHCREPFEIIDFIQDGVIANLFDTATLSVTVHDWQDDVTQVTLDATPIMGNVIDLHNTTGDVWSGEVVNTLLPDPGIYSLLVSAYSPNGPGWWLYDYVDVIVSEPVYLDRIVFASNRLGNWDIFMMNPDGTGLELLVDDASDDEYPDFSLSEQKVVFMSDRDAQSAPPPNEVLNEMYVYDILADETSKISNVCQAIYPDWSPYINPGGHGYALFVTSYLEHLPCGQEKYLGYVDVDIGLVAYLPTGVLTQYRTDPEFHSSGTRVIFAEFALGKSYIHQMDFPSGDNETALTDFGMEFQCTYNPTGTMIAYASTRNDNTDVYIKDLITQDETRITYDIEADEYPTFSPDGKQIAFVTYCDDGEHSEIYITNLTGDYFYNITNNPTSDDYAPCWSWEIF